MFSQEPRRFLKKNQLMEVICQFRFPEILAIAAKPPVDFQEASVQRPEGNSRP